MINKSWNNGTVMLQYGATKNRYKIRPIKPYTYDTHVDILNKKLIIDDFTLRKYQLHTYVFILKIGTIFKNIRYARVH